MRRKLALLNFLIVITSNLINATAGVCDFEVNNNLTAGVLSDLSKLLTDTDGQLEIPAQKIVDNILSSKEVIFKTGWLNARSNIRAEPNLDAEIIDVLPFAEEIQYSPYNEEWNLIQCGEDAYYIWKELVLDEPINYTYYNTPYSKIKSFMSYKSITSKSSNQYKLQQISYTGNYGIRQVKGRYCIAVGSAYTIEIGTYMDLILENGSVIPCILADCKADIHTDNSNILTSDGSLAEFVVDVPSLSKTIRITGDISDTCEEWNSLIIGIKIYDKKENY